MSVSVRGVHLHCLVQQRKLLSQYMESLSSGAPPSSRWFAAVLCRPDSRWFASFLYLRGIEVCTWERIEPARVDASLVICLFDSRKFLASKHRLSSMLGYLYGIAAPLMCLILSSKLTRSSYTASASSFSMLTLEVVLVFLWVAGTLVLLLAERYCLCL